MNAITKMLSGIKIEEAVASGSMFMFPVHGSNVDPIEAITLDQALASKALLVEEVSDDGSVPELIVQNRGAKDVFLLDGEQVLGLKQNRTFNLSMLLPPRSRAVVPVSCLERGRWSARQGKVVGAEHVHFASGRANKMRSVTDSLYHDGSCRSDQGRVWSDIESKLESSGEISSTCAEADFYSGRRERVAPLASAFVAKPKQLGAVFGIGRQIIGIDIFESAELYSSLSDKLLKSYLLDAIDAPEQAAPPYADEVKKKIEAIFLSPSARFPAPGAGETLRWTTLEGSGAALVSEGRCIHAMAFCDA